MRADRLVAILLLLQRREQVTAAEVAEELEVSERTARRDLEALGMAGIPVYPIRGRNGGWRLAGGGRTDLSGLNAEEARALFLVAGPQAQLTPEAKSALRKLVRALPEPLRERAEAASDAVVLDPTTWDRRDHGLPEPAHLTDVQRAVIDRQELRLGYQGRTGDPTDRIVQPLGVVAKGRTWYLVADTDAGRRTFRVDRITDLAPTGGVAVRPDGFDLAGAWEDVLERVDGIRLQVSAPPSSGRCGSRWGHEPSSATPPPTASRSPSAGTPSGPSPPRSAASAPTSRCTSRPSCEPPWPTSAGSWSSSTGPLPFPHPASARRTRRARVTTPC